jgi:hypothetical protein
VWAGCRIFYQETCAGVPDKRRGKNSHYAMADIGMAAFSVFFIQSPSFLGQGGARPSSLPSSYFHASSYSLNGGLYDA